MDAANYDEGHNAILSFPQTELLRLMDVWIWLDLAGFLYSGGFIESLADKPGDQGKWNLWTRLLVSQDQSSLENSKLCN